MARINAQATASPDRVSFFGAGVNVKGRDLVGSPRYREDLEWSGEIKHLDIAEANDGYISWWIHRPIFGLGCSCLKSVVATVGLAPSDFDLARARRNGCNFRLM